MLCIGESQLQNIMRLDIKEVLCSCLLISMHFVVSTVCHPAGQVVVLCVAESQLQRNNSSGY